jgi:hypothetical protein
MRPDSRSRCPSRAAQSEFRAALAAMGLTQFLLAAAGTAQHVDAVFAQLDVDRSGTLSLAEFVNFYTQAEAQAAADGGRDAAAMAQFNALSGGLAYMDKSAFFNALGNMGLFVGLSPAQSLCRMNEQFPLADVDNRRAACLWEWACGVVCASACAGQL